MYLSRPVILNILNHCFSGSSKCVAFPGHQNSCFSMSPTCVFFQVTHIRLFLSDPHACFSRSVTCVFFQVIHMRVFQVIHMRVIPGNPHACLVSDDRSDSDWSQLFPSCPASQEQEAFRKLRSQDPRGPSRSRLHAENGNPGRPVRYEALQEQGQDEDYSRFVCFICKSSQI